MSTEATAILGHHIADLIGLPRSGLRKMTVTVEVTKAPMVEVEYLIVAKRADPLAGVIARDGDLVRTEMKRFRLVEDKQC